MFVKPKFGNLQGRIGSLEDWIKFGDLQKFGKVFVLHVFTFEKKKQQQQQKQKRHRKKMKNRITGKQ